MTSRDRVLAVLAVLLAIAFFKVIQQMYRHVAFRTERVEIVRLEVEVEDAGFGVIHTQLRADTLRRAIEQVDEELDTARRELDRLERQIVGGLFTRGTEVTYRQRLDTYNRRVDERNRLYREWQAVVESNHAHVERYNMLVDSIRRMATVMGEPYYPIATPAEIASRRREAQSP